MKSTPPLLCQPTWLTVERGKASGAREGGKRGGLVCRGGGRRRGHARAG